MPPPFPSTRCAGCARFCSHAPPSEAWRVVIVDEANELNVNAANALLKSLEEPPPRTVFLLIASAPGRLLPTIRSRCRTLALQPLAGEALRAAAVQALAAAEKDAPGAAEWPKLERLAEGSVGRLLGLWRSGGLELYERIAELASACRASTGVPCTPFPTSCNPPPRSRASSCSSSFCSSLLARLIRAQAEGEGAPEEQELAARLIGEERLASFAALWERIGRNKAETAGAQSRSQGAHFGDGRRASAAAAQGRKPA